MGNQIQVEIENLQNKLAQEMKGLEEFLIINREMCDNESKARAIVYSAKELGDLMAQIEILRKLETRINRTR